MVPVQSYEAPLFPCDPAVKETVVPAELCITISFESCW